MTRIRRASAAQMSYSAKATECLDAIFRNAYFVQIQPVSLITHKPTVSVCPDLIRKCIKTFPDPENGNEQL
jgi:hypothetical protein